MTKTRSEVVNDIITMLKYSLIAERISGGIYRNGLRPRDSKKEDVIVIFTAGKPRQIQTGVVTIHIYVPDIDPYQNGVYVENGERTQYFERLAQDWFDGIGHYSNSYCFELYDTITTIDIPEIKQHAVVVMLRYEYFGGDEPDVLCAEDAETAIVVEKSPYPKVKFIE